MVSESDFDLLVKVVGRLIVELDNHRVVESGVIIFDEQEEFIDLLRKHPLSGFTEEEQDWAYIEGELD